MLKNLLCALTLAVSMLVGASFAFAQVDDTCTRFLDDNLYSCWVVCDNDSFPTDCLKFAFISPGHFAMGSARVGEEFLCTCNNRINNSGPEFNESHSFLCFSSGAGFDGTINRSINFDGNFYDGDANCTYKCRLDPSCQSPT